MSLETMIGGLSRDDKLAAMNLIWRNLTADSESFFSRLRGRGQMRLARRSSVLAGGLARRSLLLAR